jgi:hypothetical protein
LSQEGRWRGDWADRGPRAAAGGGHKEECPAPCLGPPLLHIPGSALGAVPLGLVGWTMDAKRRSPRGGAAEADQSGRGRNRSGGRERA